jgi:Integrase core domain
MDFSAARSTSSMTEIRCSRRHSLQSSERGVTSVKTPAKSPNCNPHAERFVKTIRYECLNHFVFFGERHLRHVMSEFVEHNLGERFHQGIHGQLVKNRGWVRERQWLDWPDGLPLETRHPFELLPPPRQRERRRWFAGHYGHRRSAERSG